MSRRRTNLLSPSKTKEIVALLNLQVAHEKFLGDGALYVISPPTGQSNFRVSTLQALCNRLWNLKNHFDAVVKKALEQVPVIELPTRIRFGLSRGGIYELKKSESAGREYIGFYLNQASRLQSYCPNIGFIASARLMLTDESLGKNGYHKVIAKKLKASRAN